MLAARTVDPIITFVPMATDVYGFWTKESREVLYEIAKRRRNFTERDSDTEYRYLMQLMALTLQRENAKILIDHRRRRPTLTPEEMDDDLLDAYGS